jgi:hypothetical protein
MPLFGRDNPENKPGQPKQAEKIATPGSDQARAGNTPPVRNDAETEMADLELREIAKSEKPVKEQGRDVAMIRPWGDYTLVSFTNGEELKIYNDQAQPAETFKSPLNSLRSPTVNGAMRRILENNPGKQYFSDDVSSAIDLQNDDYRLSNIKNKLAQDKFKAVIKTSGGKYISKQNLGGDLEILQNPKQNCQILENGKYILIADAEHQSFLAYATQNDQGVTLAPKDWKRLEWGGMLPSDLESYVALAMERKDELRPLNDTYFAYITEVGINIVPVANPKSAPLFKDNVVGVGDNISVDSQNKNVIYYCAANNPKELRKLDMSGNPSEWFVKVADFQKSYPSIRNLQVDPSGNFLLFYSNSDLILVAKETLEEVKRIPGMSNVNFDAQGRIRAIDKDDHLVILEMDADKIVQSLSKRRIARLAHGIDLADIFSSAGKKKGATPEEIIKDLTPIREEWENRLQSQLDSVINLEQTQAFKQGLAKLRQTLEQQGLNAEQVNFITEGLSEKIIKKEKTLAGGEISHILSGVEAKLKGSLSLAAIFEVKADLDQLIPLELLMDEATKLRYREISKNFNQQSADLFRREGDKILQDVQGLLKPN